MIIKIIPETEDEKKSLVEKEYRGVKDYFIFGKNINKEYKMDDFHDWRTLSYRYLFSSLKYFTEIVNDERKSHASKQSMNSIVQPQFKIVQDEVSQDETPQEIEKIEDKD
jgi:hypothetical protein